MEVEVDWAFEEAKIGSLSSSSFLNEKVDDSSERVESGESAIVERSSRQIQCLLVSLSMVDGRKPVHSDTDGWISCRIETLPTAGRLDR